MSPTKAREEAHSHPDRRGRRAFMKLSLLMPVPLTDDSANHPAPLIPSVSLQAAFSARDGRSFQASQSKLWAPTASHSLGGLFLSDTRDDSASRNRPSTRRGIGNNTHCRHLRSKCRCSMCLQITLVLAASCVLHRPMSLVIHR